MSCRLIASAAALAVAAVLASPHLLFAQGSVSLTPHDAPRWDVAAYTGWYGASKPDAAEWDEWLESGVGGAVASYAWTTHLRTEIDVSFAGRGRIYSQEIVTVPPAGTIVRTFPREYRDTTLAASVIYHPFTNRWVHPFVGAGVGLVREDLRIGVTEYRYYGPFGPGVLPARPATTDVRYHAQPQVLGGAKFYVSEDAFIRADLRFGAGGGDGASAVVRIGFGVDF
jgi:opacity protein-like surface antigen